MRSTHFVLLLLSCVPTHVAVAADMPPPVQRALTLIGTVEMPRLMLELCAAHAPQSATKNAESYEAWRQKFGELSASAWRLLEERNESLAPMLSEVTEGNVTSVHGAVKFSEKMLKGSAEARGADYMQSACTTYPDLLEKLSDGFEQRVLSQMEGLKASLP